MKMSIESAKWRLVININKHQFISLGASTSSRGAGSTRGRGSGRGHSAVAAARNAGTARGHGTRGSARSGGSALSQRRGSARGKGKGRGRSSDDNDWPMDSYVASQSVPASSWAGPSTSHTSFSINQRAGTSYSPHAGAPMDIGMYIRTHICTHTHVLDDY